MPWGFQLFERVTLSASADLCARAKNGGMHQVTTLRANWRERKEIQVVLRILANFYPEVLASSTESIKLKQHTNASPFLVTPRDLIRSKATAETPAGEKARPSQPAPAAQQTV